METDREELIPGPPVIRLPKITISVGKWFWIGLFTLVASITFSVVAAHGWGPQSPFKTGLELGEVNGAMAFLMAHPTIGWSFLYVFALVNPVEVVLAAIVLLWIASARPNSPDRVAFVPAVTLTAWILSNVAQWAYHTFGGHGTLFGAGNFVSYAAAISLVGCASIALAARGLRRLPRHIVWALCGLALAQELIYQVFIGVSPAIVVASLLLGMGVLAFGFEVAEQSGADLFTFADGDAAKRGDRTRHLRIADYVLFGSAGVVICIAIGYGLLRGTIHSPFTVGAPLGWLGGSAVADASYSIATTIGSAFLWVLIATLAMWLAFVRPEQSERLLFAAGTILAAVFVFPNIDGLFRLADHWTGLGALPAVSGYPSLETAYSIAGCLALFIAARGLRADRRRMVEIASVAAPVFVLIGLFINGAPLLHLVGGVILGVSGIVLALAIARRAGTNPFKRWA